MLRNFNTQTMCASHNVCFDSVYSDHARLGKHKIFIGMAPGVGKTYRMLDEGWRQRKDGMDVVIGWLETYDRPETDAKAESLEIIPRRKIEQGGLTFTEMDTDAIIARQPQIVLIDELAHTNVPGAKRNKRYQDVEAVLAAGIDVYSTVNIQHLESLNNQITQMTGIIVRECIPDSLLQMADQMVVVDVTPETLKERLLEGKIYPLEKMEQFVQNLFQHSNLVALRELTLRQVADNIEKQELQRSARLNRNGKVVSTNVCCIHERVLVCVSCSPCSVQLIRRGATLANYVNAPLYILFVNNPDHSLTKAEVSYIETLKQICKEFKGEFLQVSSQNVVEEIAHVAKIYRITQIVLGQTRRSKWQILFQGSLIHQLMQSLNHIDIHIISSER